MGLEQAWQLGHRLGGSLGQRCLALGLLWRHNRVALRLLLVTHDVGGHGDHTFDNFAAFLGSESLIDFGRRGFNLGDVGGLHLLHLLRDLILDHSVVQFIEDCGFAGRAIRGKGSAKGMEVGSVIVCSV